MSDYQPIKLPTHLIKKRVDDIQDIHNQAADDLLFIPNAPDIWKTCKVWDGAYQAGYWSGYKMARDSKK